jgi:hypothetical protein
MIHGLISSIGSYQLRGDPTFVYHNEKRILQFLEQGTKMKRDFLAKLEEEKKEGDIEEEEKDHEESDEKGQDNEEPGTDVSFDQIIYMLT